MFCKPDTRSRNLALIWMQLCLVIGIPWMTNSEYSEHKVMGRLPLQVINGRYEKLVVAIHESVEKDTELIKSITEALTQASHNIYKATKREIGLSLGEVLILVPSHWDLDEGDTNLEIREAAEYEIYDNAHVRIRMPINLLPDDCFDGEPYVIQPGKCGEEGAYIAIEPSAFNLSANCWGNISKILLLYRGGYVYKPNKAVN